MRTTFRTALSAASAVAVLASPSALVLTTTATKAAATLPAPQTFTIADSAYPIPAGALFVATTGNDAATGAQGQPLATVTKAVAKAPAGSTIVIREGTYREQVPGYSKQLTLQPYPNEEVWMKGSLVVEGWVANGPLWRHDGWTYEFCRTCYDVRAVDPAFPLAGWPDQVFVDGRPLTQVDSTAKVAGDTFFVDYATDQIFVGTNPAGRLVEASAFKMALNSFTSAAGGVIRGLGFAQYAPFYNAAESGMVRVNATNFVIEKNTFVQSAYQGLVLYGSTDTIVRDNTFLASGGPGTGGFKADRLLMEGNRIANANLEHWDKGWAVAGAKFATMKTATVRNNVFEDNDSKGFWCDISCYDFTIVGNVFRNHTSHAIFYELSSKAIVAGNVVTGSSTYGIRLSGSNDVRIYNNTLLDNTTDLSVHDTQATNTHAGDRALGITWIAGDVVAHNNVMSHGFSGAVTVNVEDQSYNPFKPASTMLVQSDHNAYYRESNDDNRIPLTAMYEVLGQPAQVSFEPPGAGSTDPRQGDPMFMDEDGGDYRLDPASSIVGSGAPLPADVAAALGLAVGGPANIGALPTGSGAVTPPVTPPAPPATTVVFSDTFNRTDSPTTLGAGWQVRGTGTWGVSGGKAMSSGANQTTAVATCAADGEVSVDVTVGGDVGVVIRGVDTNNYLFVQQSGFIKRSNGVFVRLSNLKSAMGNGTWRVAASGDRITATNATGVVVLDYKLTADEAARYTGTACGMRANQDTTSRFDNFVFTVAAA